MSIICGGCKKDISPGAENSLVLGSNCPSCGAHFGRVGLSCIGRPGQYDVVVSGPAGSGGWRPCAGAIVPEVGTIAVKSTGSCISGQTMTMSASDSYTRKRELDEALSQLAALREELASANEKIDQAWNRTNCIDHKGFIPGALDAWKRPVKQHLPYDFSGNPGETAIQYCNGWNDAGGYWSAHASDLQQRLAAAERRNGSLLDTARSLTIQLHAGFGNTELHEDCIHDLNALETANAQG